MNSSRVMLLIALICASAITVQAQCPYYTKSDSTCAENCTNVQIKDPFSKRCLDKIAQCTGAVYISKALCLPSCPATTIQGVDLYTKVKVCLDYAIDLSKYPVCDQFLDQKTGQCVVYDACKTRAILPLKLCLTESVCPAGFVEGQASLPNGGMITACVPKPFEGITPNNCYPDITDYANNGCIKAQEECKGFYNSSGQTCQAGCPANTKKEQITETYGVCSECLFKDIKGNCYQTCPSTMKADDVRSLCLDSSFSCSSTQIFDIVTPTCLDAPQYCKYFFVKATQTCESKCPVFHRPVDQTVGTAPNTLTYKSCEPCRFQDANGNCYEKCPSNMDTDFFNSKCVFPPCIGVFDVSTSTCLDGAWKCLKNYVPASKTCQDACPVNYAPEKQFIQNISVNVCVICNFRDVNQKCVEKCPSPSIPDLIKKVCILPTCTSPQVKDQSGNCLDNVEQCKGYYLKSENSCLNECPSGYSIQEVTNATYKICIPCLFKDIKGTCYERCPTGLIVDSTGKLCIEPPKTTCSASQITDYVNTSCLDSPEFCKYYFLKEKMACLETCPQLYKVKEQNYGNAIVKVCYPCFFQDEKGNCYEQCPTTMRVDTTRRLCIADPYLSCTGYYVKGTGQCLISCPFGYEAIETTTPRICIPCTNSTCATNSVCTLKLSSDKKICSEVCPNMEIALPQVSGQTYIQCQKCPSEKYVVNLQGTNCQLECSGTEVVFPYSRRCVAASQCTTFVQKEGYVNICVKQCPINQVPVAVAGQKYQLCTDCKQGEFVDTTTQKCIASCSLYDANGVTCLKSINDCTGFISSDAKSCGKECNAGEFYVKNATNYTCYPKCPNGYFMNGKLCTKECPVDWYADNLSGYCVSVKFCKLNVTFDYRGCVYVCPAGQFPQQTSSGLKVCKTCTQKLSSDGFSCAKDCPATDVYDVDLKQCLNLSKATTCANKVFTSDRKQCSTKCPNGQLQITDASGVKTCLKSIYDCPYYISSSYKECVKECLGVNEAVIVKGNNKVCVPCKYGPTSDRTACASYQQCDSLTQKFDLDLQQCVLNESCNTKYTSVDGRKCSTKCVYPEVIRASASTSQCYKQCETGEIFDREKGCVAPAGCDQYLASNGKTCVEQCIYIKEAIDESATNPKKCKQCLETEVATVVLNAAGDSKVIKCVAKQDDPTQNTNTAADSLKTVLELTPKIQPEQKDAVKEQVTKVATSIESTITSTTTNVQLTEDQKKQQIQSLIKSVRDVANTFIKKLEQSTTDSDSSLSLGQKEFQLVAEKKKEGLAFLVSFVLQDFFGATAPSLQTDPLKASAATLASSVRSNIETLSALNVAQNPYCQNKEKCSSTGLFTVDYTLTSSGRMLQSQDQPTFQLTYSVEAAKISKSICVSYDEATGNVQPAVGTSANTATNQITCTFYNNSDLYYDSDCQYIDKSLCSTGTTTNPTNNQTFDDVEISSGSTIIFSIVSLVAMIVSLF